MTTVKVKFRPSTVEGRPGTIVYFVTHRRAVRQITTGYKVFPHEWDDKQSSLVVTSAGEQTAVIQAVAQRDTPGYEPTGQDYKRVKQRQACICYRRDSETVS